MIKHTINSVVVTLILLLTPLFSHASLIYINEIHYDNVGADDKEFVELAGTAGTSLLDWSLLLYNGSTGLVYDTVDIGNITLTDMSNGFGFHSLSTQGLQNGTGVFGDGIALVDNNNQLRQFISYEAVFLAQDGAAQGILSQDIGISQHSTPKGMSLQLKDNNNQNSTWILAEQTSGKSNVIAVSEPNITLLYGLLSLLILWQNRKPKQLLESVF